MERAAGTVRRPGLGLPCHGGPPGGLSGETSGTHATVFNNLTFSRHADPSQVCELAGRAVAGGDHELPLAVHSGAVQVTGLAGDVDVVVWGDGGPQGWWDAFGDFPSPSHGDCTPPQPGERKGLAQDPGGRHEPRGRWSDPAPAL